MKVKIIGLNHTGEGIAKIDNKVIFIDKAIPEDMVEIDKIKEHKNYAKASIKEILKSSPNRAKIKCPYYDKCGGCQLLGLNYDDQLMYKKEKVQNILKKYACLEVEPPIIGTTQYNYRNKITLQVENKILGLYESNSNVLVPIKKCLLISDKMNELIPLINNNLDLSKITQIIIRENNNQLMITFIGELEPESAIKVLSNKVSSIYINKDLIYGSKKITETLGKYTFEISPYSFFQVNKSQTINLYNEAKKFLGNNHQNILDLYCGTGSIGIYVSDCAKKITGIELNPSSVRDAKENIKRNNLKNIKIEEGSVGKVLKSTKKYDAIIVDPPRSGLDKQTKKTLLQIGSSKIVYISCNPITLARDLKDLEEKYQLDNITLFDMFPNTYHVECVCSLSIK